ncbi:MAG: NAD-dependent epimerase/dehydratase family protein, partial [Myxococcales bacterium]|nr:NAD-dependent epimerase/dehydratase family protein [Myxococcales bacterium]
MPAPLALVTGATGFIGHHVVQALLGAGWRVRALVRPRSDVTALATLGSELCLGDVGEPSSLDPAVAGCAAVFHLASLLKVPWKADFHRVNVAGAEHVAAACARASAPPTLVLMSSLAAAGPAPRGGQR